jgi:NAD(P)-dependent dehydrogenase (short-subunit alcohol dehydrogenase family)
MLHRDVTDPASVQQVAADLDRRYGRLGVLVNNAAIHCDTWQRASTADHQVIREALEVNLLGAWQTSLTLLPLLRQSGHGRIVNVSSEAVSLASMAGGSIRLQGLQDAEMPLSATEADDG